jgi:putative ABC transport system substrate-binding protein
MGQIRRREFLIAISVLVAAQRTMAQQTGRTFRVGVILSGSEHGMSGFLQTFRDRLATNGFVEGRNLSIEIRTTAYDSAIDLEAAQALAATKPDAIFAFSSRITLIAQKVAGSVPVVFTFVGDAVAFGIVKDFAHPGGNTTGASWRQFELTAKRLELMRELLPRAKRVVFAGFLGDVTYRAIREKLREVAVRFGFELIYADGSSGRLDETVRVAMLNGADAIFVYQPISMLGMVDFAKAIIKDATAQRIPVFFPEIELVALGGLLSYGPSSVDEVRRGADQLARVLRGEKPSNLPVSLPDRFALTINAKVAKSLKITIPQSIAVRADEVIQ